MLIVSVTKSRSRLAEMMADAGVSIVAIEEDEGKVDRYVLSERVAIERFLARQHHIFTEEKVRHAVDLVFRHRGGEGPDPRGTEPGHQRHRCLTATPKRLDTMPTLCILRTGIYNQW